MEGRRGTVRPPVLVIVVSPHKASIVVNYYDNSKAQYRNLLLCTMTIDTNKFRHLRPPYPVKRRGKDRFIPNIRVPEKFKERSEEIRRLDRELDRFILSKDDYFQLVTKAYSENVHYSTMLEGNPLDAEEVTRITRNTFRGMEEPAPDGPRMEIINHLVEWLDPLYLSLPWSMDAILQLHGFLMEHDPLSRPGELRSEEDRRTFTITDDSGEDVFIPTPNTHVKAEMERWLEWVNTYSPGYDPLAAAPVLFHEFESIHPFYDGNGRTGRTLFHVYLRKMGLENSKLCRIERHLVGNRQIYYDILAWTDHALDYMDLIDYMTDCILESYREAVEVFSRKDLLSSDMDETSKRILLHKGSRILGGRGVLRNG